jgi:hypothetical protein
MDHDNAPTTPIGNNSAQSRATTDNTSSSIGTLPRRDRSESAPMGRAVQVTGGPPSRRAGAQAWTVGRQQDGG